MRRTFAPLASLTVLVLIAIAAAGCGSSAKSGTASGEPIVVGAPIPLTGPWAADGQSMQQGLQIAVDEINAKGGVLGRPLKLDVYDVEDMAPEKLNAAASKLIMKDKANVVIAGYSTPGADVTAFGKYPTPFLQFDASSQNVSMIEKNPTQYGNVFTLGDTEAAYGKQTFSDLLALPYTYPNKKVVILAGDFEWDKKVTEGIKAEALAQGWQVPMYQLFPYGTREWGPILTQIRAINPAIIDISVMDPADVKTFLEQFSANPTQSIVEVGYAVSIQGFPQLVGTPGNGVVGIATTSILDNPLGNNFKKAFETKFGTTPGLSIVGTCYDAVNLWAAAVEKAGKVDDYTGVGSAIKSLNYVGVQGNYTFGAGNTVPATDQGLPMFFLQVQDGKLVVLKQGTQDKATFVKPSWIK
jgi:ABC-type branched-subunit amino acid transport system substrate-binding protein